MFIEFQCLRVFMNYAHEVLNSLTALMNAHRHRKLFEIRSTKNASITNMTAE